jgi:hypothetical protein
MPTPASLGAEARNSVIAVGAPWYTSGTHMWKGTAPSLKPTPTTMNTTAKAITTFGWSPEDRREGDLGQVQAAGHAVQHRHAVQQQARSQRAKHEVLHRGFGATGDSRSIATSA